MKHSVHLPHPARDGITVGQCKCGWMITYSWGEHGDAAWSAGEHIEQAALAQPIEVAEVCGDRRLYPGPSL